MRQGRECAAEPALGIHEQWTHTHIHKPNQGHGVVINGCLPSSGCGKERRILILSMVGVGT